MNSSRFLPVTHRSQAAPQPFPPSSSSPASSSPLFQSDPGRCRHRCRSSPRLPSSSSYAYGTLEIGHKNYYCNSHSSNLYRWWFIIPLSEITHLLPGGAVLWLPASDRPPGSTGWLLLSSSPCESPRPPAAGPWRRPPEA